MKIGDEVLVTGVCDDNHDVVGKIGKIIGLYNSTTYGYIVEFPFKFYRGHSGHDHEGRDGYCWNFPKRYLKVIIQYEKKLKTAFENRKVDIRKNGSIILIKSPNKMIAIINTATKNVKYGDLKTRTELNYKSLIEDIMKEEN